MTIPNAITLVRFCLIPLIVVLIQAGEFQAAFVVFALAGLTDALDGIIARRFNQQSELGAYLDALADKLLIGASVVALFAAHALPYWLVVLVIFRDVMIVGAVAIAWLLNNPIPIEPLLISKCNTAAQIGAVGYALAAGSFFVAPATMTQVVHLGVALLTILSVGAYFVKWFQHMAD
ncbi:PgsA Phosphatidylglycerophosphate synthase [Rhabdaerophilaceae bacterium]